MNSKIQTVTAKDILEFCQSLDDADLNRLQNACMDEILNRAIASLPSTDDLIEELANTEPFCDCPPKVK